jgi:hypothetical protein
MTHFPPAGDEGPPGDLDEAIEAMTETLAATVGDDAVDIGGELGLLLQARFLARSSGAPIEGVQATAAGEDLESAIGLLTPAAARPDPDPAVVAALGGDWRTGTPWTATKATATELSPGCAESATNWPPPRTPRSWTSSWPHS